MVFESTQGNVSGNIAVSIIDLEDRVPTTVISVDNDFSIKAHVKIHFIGSTEDLRIGKLTAHFYLESIGPGKETNFTDETMWEAGKEKYDFDVYIKKRTIPEGIYKVVVLISVTNIDGKPLPIAGISESGTIQIY